MQSGISRRPVPALVTNAGNSTAPDGTIPNDAQLGAVRAGLAPTAYREVFPRNDHACAEAYRLGGIEVEFAHFEVDETERRLADALFGRDPGSTQYKAVMGILRGRPLHGADLIEQWQARCAEVPDVLARSMVEHYLRQTMPLWYFASALERRDATLWVQQTLATNALNVLGILAGLNRRFYSTFQFKRMRHFVGSLPIVPPNLADRLEAIVSGDTQHGIEVLEELMRESLELVELHLPEANTSELRHPPGARQQPWHVSDLEKIAHVAC
ncbi:MAG: hypothetical protein JOZ65_08720 [Chloroflexi bacterium]|nr:hypothetical protein [Chloroflexota bacterium]